MTRPCQSQRAEHLPSSPSAVPVFALELSVAAGMRKRVDRGRTNNENEPVALVAQGPQPMVHEEQPGPRRALCVCVGQFKTSRNDALRRADGRRETATTVCRAKAGSNTPPIAGPSLNNPSVSLRGAGETRGLLRQAGTRGRCRNGQAGRHGRRSAGSDGRGAGARARLASDYNAKARGAARSFGRRFSFLAGPCSSARSQLACRPSLEGKHAQFTSVRCRRVHYRCLALAECGACAGLGGPARGQHRRSAPHGVPGSESLRRN